MAQRETQVVELPGRGGIEEIALVAAWIGAAQQLRPALLIHHALHVMAGGEAVGAEVARGVEQVAELDPLVAADAGDRRFAAHIRIREVVDHRLAEAAFVIQHVMRDAQTLGHLAGIMDILPGAAGALARDGGAVVVKLQRDADDLITLAGQQAGHHRGIHAARHRHHHAGGGGGLRETERIKSGRSHDVYICLASENAGHGGMQDAADGSAGGLYLSPAGGQGKLYPPAPRRRLSRVVQRFCVVLRMF